MSHPIAAAAFNQDEERTSWHDTTLWLVRQKRDEAAVAVPEWEKLREAASQIKSHTLSNLDTYLKQFEKNAIENGVHVHWALDAAEHNRIVGEILQEHGARRLVKSKSMLTEECGLNPYLESCGIDVIDTDLGERIVQLAEQKPSHIVMPAIHLKKEEIGDLFHQKLGSDPGATDPEYLTGVARRHLRAKFLAADAALTGVNFAVAETGGIVVCTNEGNADLGTHLAPIHIASVGIEKLIPRAEHLGVFLRLLARSATGQDLTVYTSHFHRPRTGAALHVILVDNGRSKRLGSPEFRDALKCIRCGACMNTCPVYRRSGGHSYNWTIPGPIGSILAPGTDLDAYSSLPFASTLCGSCSDVCPVKIDIHGQLYTWRQRLSKTQGDSGKSFMMGRIGGILASPGRYRLFGHLGRWVLRHAPRLIGSSRLNSWGISREMPEAPRKSFRSWYLENRGAE